MSETQSASPQKSNKAIGSLILGVASFPLSLLAAVPAIILGHTAKSEIRRSEGRVTGDGMAMAGLIFGYFNAVVAVFAVAAIILLVPNLKHATMMANEEAAIASMRNLNDALALYAATYDGYPGSIEALGPGSPSSASRADMIDADLASGTKDGYEFVYSAGPDANGKITSFTVHANPVTPGTTGQRGFFTDESGVIRQSSAGPASVGSSPLG